MEMEEHMSKENVLVYGMDNFYLQNEKSLNGLYHIRAFIDKKGGGDRNGKIIQVEEIPQYEFDKIIIMVWSIQESIRISQNLLYEGIKAEQIILGHALYGRYHETVDEIAVAPDGALLLTFGNVRIKVRTEDEFHNVCEVFVNRTYDYFINNGKRDIVLDVGMNIGDATLYFAGKGQVDRVYGYEPFRETFLAAEGNLRDCLDSGKAEIFQYGISNENAVRKVCFNSGMTCGQSSIADIREKAYGKYLGWGLAEAENERMEQIMVRRASEVFGVTIRQFPKHNIVLKMDCEGEEYGILEELSASGILGNIKCIMLEWHYHGADSLLHHLQKAGFSWWCNDKNSEMGLIYAYKE